MKKLKKIFIILTILFIGGLLIYFSPIGNFVLKNYVKYNLCFNKNLNIKHFSHSFNSFSMILTNKNGNIKILGTLFPFEGYYKANLNNVHFLIPLIKGKFYSRGDIKKQNNVKTIEGNFFYSEGNGFFNFQCINGKVMGNIKGQDFNTHLLLKNINNFKFPFFNKIILNGKNNLQIAVFKNIKINSSYNGYFTLNNIQLPLKALVSVNLFRDNNFNFDINFTSSRLMGIINGIKKSDKFVIKATLNKFDLSLLKEILLYPVVGNIKLNCTYNVIDNLLNFSSNGFSGYKDNKSINIQIDMPLKRFFKFLNISPFLKGEISGNIVIDGKKGVFHLLIKNAFLIPNKVISKLDHITKLKLENIKSVYFLNGKFDSQKIKFDFISKNPVFYIYLKKGVYYYKKGQSNFLFILKTKYKTYVIKLINNKVKIIKEYLNNTHYKVLVY